MKNRISELVFECDFNTLDNYQQLKVLEVCTEFGRFADFRAFYEGIRPSHVTLELLECYLCYLLRDFVDSMQDEYADEIRSIACNVLGGINKQWDEDTLGLW